MSKNNFSLPTSILSAHSAMASCATGFQPVRSNPVSHFKNNASWFKERMLQRIFLQAVINFNLSYCRIPHCSTRISMYSNSAPAAHPIRTPSTTTFYRFLIAPIPMGILFIAFIICFICSNCFRKAFTSPISFPQPRASRRRRLRSITSGLLRS